MQITYDWSGFKEKDFEELRKGEMDAGHIYGRVPAVVYDNEHSWRPGEAQTVLVYIMKDAASGHCTVSYREEMKSGCTGRFLGEYREVPVGTDYLTFRNTVLELTAGILDGEYDL
jgi:hypothetical protein